MVPEEPRLEAAEELVTGMLLSVVAAVPLAGQAPPLLPFPVLQEAGLAEELPAAEHPLLSAVTQILPCRAVLTATARREPLTEHPRPRSLRRQFRAFPAEAARAAAHPSPPPRRPERQDSAQAQAEAAEEPA